MVREIVNQIQIAWLQLIFGNTLLYLVSVTDCTGPEHGILCILIVDIISRRAYIGFILLCDRD